MRLSFPTSHPEKYSYIQSITIDSLQEAQRILLDRIKRYADEKTTHKRVAYEYLMRSSSTSHPGFNPQYVEYFKFRFNERKKTSQDINNQIKELQRRFEMISYAIRLAKKNKLNEVCGILEGIVNGTIAKCSSNHEIQLLRQIILEINRSSQHRFHAYRNNDKWYNLSRKARNKELFGKWIV